MADEPAAAALLAAARRALLDEVVPGLSGRARFAALMVANAMGVAAREVEAAGRAAEVRAALLAGAGSVAALAALIRSGARDGDPGLFERLAADNAVAAAVWKPSAAPRVDDAASPQP